MVKESKKKDDNPKGSSSFKKFIKKRAPIYLGVIALVVVFIVPELTKGDLESSLPQNLTDEEQMVLDALMSYKGPNGVGLSVKDAIKEKINDEYSDEKIYDNKKTRINVEISNIDSANYQVLFNFESHKGQINYDWNVNIDTGEVDGNDPKSKHIIDLVDFFD